MLQTTKKPNRMSPAEFSKSDSLDWDVVKGPVLVQLPNGQNVKLPTRVALIREDTYRILGEVSPRYEIFQNSSLQALIAPHVEEGLLQVVNQGFLGGGRRVFIQAKMAEEFRAAGETHHGMLTLLNSHDGSAPLSSGVTTVRVVCQNSFAMAMDEMSNRIRHYSDIGVKAETLSLSDTIEYVNQGMQDYSKCVDALARTPTNADVVADLIRRSFKKEQGEVIRAEETIIELFRHGKGNEGKTLWDAFNGLTEYLTHKSRKSENGRFSYNNFGSGALIARRAMNFATAIAGNK